MTSADFDPQYGYPRAGSSHGRPGGLGARFFARLIDGILINIVVFVVSLFLFDRDYWWLVTGLFSGVLMFEHMGWQEVADGIIRGMEKAISNKTVTYDFERQMTGAKLLKCSEFGKAIIDNM